jgi:hypothetical protein
MEFKEFKLRDGRRLKAMLGARKEGKSIRRSRSTFSNGNQYE